MLNIARPFLHKLAYDIIKEKKEPLSVDEILKEIKSKNLFQFKENVDESNILRTQLERKTSNSNFTNYPKDEILFFRNDENKYGLFSELSYIEKSLFKSKNFETKFIQDEIKDLKNSIKELKGLKEKLHKIDLEILEIKNLEDNKEIMNERFDEFNIKLSESKKQYSETNELITKFENEKNQVENLLKDLKGNKHLLNLEKLDNGFNELLRKKESKLQKSLRFLVIFGMLIFCIPFSIIVLTIFNIEINIILSIPILVIEIFIIYYFRIMLHNFNSIEEQILQIENKSALLKFISNYMEFKKENKIKQNEISKFEEIIFNKISPNMKTIPTSPDVISLVEKIAKIIKK